MLRRTVIYSLLFFGNHALIPNTVVRAEIINAIVAIVGNQIITSIDLKNEEILIKKAPTFFSPSKDSLQQRALDSLINKEIISIVADQESIIISNKRLDNHVQQEVKVRNLKNIGAFKKIVEKDAHLSWEEYLDLLRYKLITQQIAQLKVAVEQPSEAVIKAWYNKNKARIGHEYYYRIIQVNFTSGNIKSELRANKEILQAFKLARKNFSKSAKRYSKHPSASRGGLVAWQAIDKVAISNPQLASVISQLPLQEISQEIRLGNAYYLIKVEKKRFITLSRAKSKILTLLVGRKQQKALEKWFKQKQQVLAIKILLPLK